MHENSQTLLKEYAWGISTSWRKQEIPPPHTDPDEKRSKMSLMLHIHGHQSAVCNSKTFKTTSLPNPRALIMCIMGHAQGSRFRTGTGGRQERQSGHTIQGITHSHGCVRAETTLAGRPWRVSASLDFALKALLLPNPKPDPKPGGHLKPCYIRLSNDLSS